MARLLSSLSYLISGLAGALACAALYHSPSISDPNPTPPTPPPSTPQIALAERLERKRAVAAILEAPPLRTRQQRIESQREKRARQTEWDLEDLAEIQALTSRFRHSADLSGELDQAFAHDDDKTRSALFLEWHRRDPGAAFAELARRPRWLDDLTFFPALIGSLPPGEILAEYCNRDRRSNYRSAISKAHARWLGARGDLQGLKEALGAVGEQKGQEFFEAFEERWMPSDATAAADLISKDLPEENRDAFLRSLREDENKDWKLFLTPGLASELLQRSTDENQIAVYLRNVPSGDAESDSTEP